MQSLLKITVTHATTLKQKTIGLIGKDKINPLLINTRFGIHTLGMKVPIDILILDQHMVVRKLKKRTNTQPCLFLESKV